MQYNDHSFLLRQSLNPIYTLLIHTGLKLNERPGSEIWLGAKGIVPHIGVYYHDIVGKTIFSKVINQLKFTSTLKISPSSSVKDLSISFPIHL